MSETVRLTDLQLDEFGGMCRDIGEPYAVTLNDAEVRAFVATVRHERARAEAAEAELTQADTERAKWKEWCQAAEAEAARLRDELLPRLQPLEERVNKAADIVTDRLQVVFDALGAMQVVAETPKRGKYREALSQLGKWCRLCRYHLGGGAALEPQP